jgi:hypothetical protein
MAEKITNVLMRMTPDFYRADIDRELGTTDAERLAALSARIDGPGGFRERLAQEDRRPKDE